MRKAYLIVILLIFLFTITGCDKRSDFEISIVIPAGNSKYVYSDEEISPLKSHITISSSEESGDTEIVLKAVESKSIYRTSYLTPGIPIEMDVEKGAWFKVGVSIKNTTDEDINVQIRIQDIEVRIE